MEQNVKYGNNGMLEFVLEGERMTVSEVAGTGR
jgi:hypothetical protein